MIYFCADDYGISKESNSRIEECFKNGVLNKVSVLPNGTITDFKDRLSDVELSLHINLVEGYPISDKDDVSLLVSEKGNFRYSFAGLFLLSISPKRKIFEKQVYLEMQNQIKLWKKELGNNTSISIDSHQHTHMIPLVFKTLMRVIRDEGASVKYIRIPSEPIVPYILTPSLYLSYSPLGLIKQCILKILSFINRKELKKSEISYCYYMGAMFSGQLTEKKIKKVLPRYLKLANKNNMDIEIGFHPGWLENADSLNCGTRKDWKKFYLSPWRKVEYNTLINFKF